MVAVVYVSDVSVNEAQIESGQAWAAPKYLRKKPNPDWCALEANARLLKRGLWAQPTSQWIEPSEWRHRNQRKEPLTNYSSETTAKCVAAIGRK
jgi:endonuclease YncB( thermonuclease family)